MRRGQEKVSMEKEGFVILMKDWLRFECAEMGRAERTAGTRARLEYTGPGCHAGARRGEMEAGYAQWVRESWGKP